MRLSGNAEVSPHVDTNYYWRERMRVHVPIVTQPSVRFICGEAELNMKPGECWIFDTWRRHRVINEADASRIHLVVDTVGGDGFWGLTASGRPHDGPRPGWHARMIRPGEAAPALAFEALNVPAVMSPWELNSQLGMLFADVLPTPDLAPVQQLASQLLRTWRGLWAQFGEAPEGRHQFRAALDRFIEGSRIPSASLVLRNDVRWYGAMVMALGKFAVADVRPDATGDDVDPADLG